MSAAAMDTNPSNLLATDRVLAVRRIAGGFYQVPAQPFADALAALRA